jgi:hypothetical protein
LGPGDVPGQNRQLSNEDQDHCDDECEQTEKFSSREADEQTALLAISRCRIAKSALKERSEDVTHTTGGKAGTNCCKTGTDQLCCFCVHDINSCSKLKWVVEKLSVN